MCLDHTENTIVNGSNMLVENYLTESDKDLYASAIVVGTTTSSEQQPVICRTENHRACQRVGQTDFAPNNERYGAGSNRQGLTYE